LDNCPLIGSSIQFADTDADGYGSACDNCETVYNPSQTDTDNDGIGDVCDSIDNTILAPVKSVVPEVVSGGTSGGGGGSSTTKTDLVAGQENLVSIRKEGIEILDIRAFLETTANNVEIVVRVPPSTPIFEIDKAVYQYIEVVAGNLDQTKINKIVFDFRVSKDWLKKNNVKKGTVALYRYSREWQAQPTTLVREDDDNVYYQASSKGLSVFAISGELSKIETCNNDRICEEFENPETCPSDCRGIICESDTLRCGGKELQICNSNGKSWNTLEVCEAACYSNQCVEKEQVVTTTLVISILTFWISAVVYMINRRRQLSVKGK